MFFNNGSTPQQKQQPIVVSGARRNGLFNYLDTVLSSLGKWSTYSQVETPTDLLKAVSQTSGKFLGFEFFTGSDTGGFKIKTIVLALMAVHALEQISGGLVSLTSRLFIKGEVIGRWHGIVIRRNPITPKKATLLNFLTNGLVQPFALGVYFYEGGRTWECESFAVKVRGGYCRVLTRVSSFGVPRREHFFDRSIVVPGPGGMGVIGDNIQTGADGEVRNVSLELIVDIVLGREHPHNIPGYIGSTNELENTVSVLGWAKRILFMISWLLVEESERDMPLAGLIDYSVLNPGLVEQSNKGQGQVAANFWRYPNSAGVKGGQPSIWPSVSRTGGAPAASPQAAQPAKAVQLEFNLPNEPARANPVRPTSPPASPAAGSPSPEDGPYYRVKDRIQIGEKFYPVLVRQRSRDMFTLASIIDAIYYDPADNQWKSVTNPETLKMLDAQLEAGQIQVTTNWQYLL